MTSCGNKASSCCSSPQRVPPGVGPSRHQWRLGASKCRCGRCSDAAFSAPMHHPNATTTASDSSAMAVAAPVVTTGAPEIPHGVVPRSVHIGPIRCGDTKFLSIYIDGDILIKQVPLFDPRFAGQIPHADVWVEVARRISISLGREPRFYCDCRPPFVPTKKCAEKPSIEVTAGPMPYFTNPLRAFDLWNIAFWTVMTPAVLGGGEGAAVTDLAAAEEDQEHLGDIGDIASGFQASFGVGPRNLWARWKQQAKTDPVGNRKVTHPSATTCSGWVRAAGPRGQA